MKKPILEMVNVPGSPGVTTGKLGAPWPCSGIVGRWAVIMTEAGIPDAASVTDTTKVSVPTSGPSIGGLPSVTADTSAATYAPAVEVTVIPGVYITAGVSWQTVKSASICMPASVCCASDPHPANAIAPAPTMLAKNA